MKHLIFISVVAAVGLLTLTRSAYAQPVSNVDRSVDDREAPSRPLTGLGHSPQDLDFENWIVTQSSISQSRMFANISAPGTARGSVIASPSKADPDYFYFWVRDGSLTMNTVLDLQSAPNSNIGALSAMMDDYRIFSRKIQMTITPPGLGDPRFNADGSADYTPWGRPQNDGPALRALTFIRMARALIARGRTDYVKQNLYKPTLPADTVIKADLEYVGHYWTEKSIDLWEEIRGQHFFTRAVQLASLVEGAALATQLGDSGAATFYRSQASLLDAQLNQHWDDQKGYFLATLESEASPDHQKPSQLDTAVILGVLAANQEQGTLSPLSDRVLSTATALENTFAAIYPINSDKTIGTAIGRYSEDYYYGGNPWFLTTAAFAQLHYRVAKILNARTSYFLTPFSAAFFAACVSKKDAAHVVSGVDITANPQLKMLILNGLVAKGDGFLNRVRKHVGPQGEMSEQFFRDTGFMGSARDLTWSYSGVLEAMLERDLIH